ncbi:PLxRFG domain-containing protein [Acinetobacter junii]|uniref:PLxRFG domain-containing protein n=1 Tax=Acinetobacter junii TaxID=40215 RepID=UPI001D181B24|nr:PLxRFG domain-containing protein [Acinetobacter junii]
MSDQNQIDWEKGTIQEPNQIDWDNGQISQPKEKKDKGFLGQAKDHAVSFLGKGTVAVGELAVGLSDMMSDGATGKILSEKLGYDPKAAKNVMTGWQSEQYQQQLKDSANIGNRKIEEGDDFATKVGKKFDNAVDITKNAINNPSLITNTVAESLPSMLVGGLLGRASGIANPVVAGSVGEVVAMAGSQAEQIRQETIDGRLTADQSLASVATGAIGGLFGYVGGRLAQKMGLSDVDTAMQTGRLTTQQVGEEIAKTPMRAIPTAVIKGAISEGFLEELPQSVSEQILQNLALDKPWHDGVENAAVMGTLAGMAMGGTVSGAGKTGDWWNSRSDTGPQDSQQQSGSPNLPSAPSQSGSSSDSALTGEYIPRENAPQGDNQGRTAFVYDQPSMDADNLLNNNGFDYGSAATGNPVSPDTPPAPNGNYFDGDYGSEAAFDDLLNSVPPVSQTPSQQMGINPNDGPMSSAAALAVDTGVSSQMQQAAAAAAQNENNNSPLTTAAGLLNAPNENSSSNESGTGSSSNGPLGETSNSQLRETSGSISTVANSNADDSKDNNLERPGDTALLSNTIGNDGKDTSGRNDSVNSVSGIGEPSQAAPGQPDRNNLNTVGNNSVLSGENEAAATSSSTIGTTTGDSQNRTVEPILGADGKNKWFGNQDKANAFLEKKNLGNDYQVVQDGKRFEIQPKVQAPVQAKISDLEQQLTNEKSVIKKVRLRKQITELQNGLTEQAQSSVSLNQPQKTTVENLSSEFKKIEDATTRVNAVRQRIREANPEIFTAENDRVRETHGLTNARLTMIADEIETSGSYELSDREYYKVKNNPNYKINYNPKTFIGKVTAVKDPHSGEWVGNNEQSDLDNAAHEAATSVHNDLPEPTQAQIEAGNYKKGHIKVHGLDIAIENPRGSERRGTDPDGNEWSHNMSDHYGYIKRTTGADQEHIDTYVGKNPESENVFIVDQIDQGSGGFDEHKVMLGFDSQEEAITAYKSNFDKGWKVGPVTQMSKDQFKDWLKNSDTSKPVAESGQKIEPQHPVNKWQEEMNKALAKADPEHPLFKKLQASAKNGLRSVSDRAVALRQAREIEKKAEAQEQKYQPEKPKVKAEPSKNTLVSDDRAAELRARLKAKLSQLNSGIDPEIMAIGAELAVYHIERGARKFAALAKNIANDLGVSVDKIRPYLRSWYNGARDMMEDMGADIQGMDSADTVRTELKKLDNSQQSNDEVSQTENHLQENEVTHIEGKKSEKATNSVVEESLDKAEGNLTKAQYDKMRNELIADIEQAIAIAPNDSTEQITFDVKGDGKFKVRNDKPTLTKFLKQVKANAGFKPPVKPKKAGGSTIGANNPINAIKDMLTTGRDEYSVSNAYELAKANDVQVIFSRERNKIQPRFVIRKVADFDGNTFQLAIDIANQGVGYAVVNEHGGPLAFGNTEKAALEKANGYLTGETNQARTKTAAAKYNREVERSGDTQAKLKAEFEKTLDALFGDDTQTDQVQSIQDEDGIARVQEAPQATVDKSEQQPKEAIRDLGEKIGGARKDTALSTGKSKKNKSNDDRPTWAKRYTISEIVSSTNSNETGKWVIEDSKKTDWKGSPKKLGMFDSEQEAKDMLPVVAVGLKHRVYARRDGESGFEIWRQINDVKRVKVVNKVFDTKNDAQTYLIENANNILETSTTFGELDLPRPENTVRKGIERRKGDAKDTDFMKVFGFRGVEFGNWNNQEERQQLLNDAYDGLLDLAEVLKIPAKAISLNGDLALAFGARGQGLSSARAHYEPAKVVINLTKMNGAGSLAHEWWHAFDHYLARQDGIASAEWVVDADGTRSLKISNNSKDRMVSHGFSYRNSGVREDVRNAYTDLMKTMSTKAEQYVEDVQAVDKFVGQSRGRVKEQLDSLREDLSRQRDPKYYKRHNKPASAEQLVVFDTISQKLINGELLETEWRADVKNKSAHGIFSGARWTNDALEQLGEIYKSVRGRSGFSKDQDAVLDRLRSAMNSYANRLKMLADAQKEVSKTRKIPTKFVMDAKNLDEGRGSDYWTTPHELSARAFQGFVEDKITENNGRSPFLNHAPENAAIETPWGWVRPYPHGDERKAINAKFSDLIDTLKTEETETGIKLYSRDKLKPDNERRGASPLDTTFTPLSVVSATRRVLSILQHLKMSATQDASSRGRINVSLNNRIGVNKVGNVNSNGFGVQVISSFSDLPKVIQNDATYKDENGKTQNYDVSGVWHDGTLYVVADQVYGDSNKQLTTFDAYEELLTHEIVGHFGVQKLFGNEYKTKFQQLFNALGKLEGIRKIAKDNGVDMQQFESAYIEPYTQGVKDEIYTESDVQQALVSELFAFVAQNAESRPFVRQKLKEVIGYIRQWFRDRGFDKFLSRYNDADLMMFLSEARKAVVDRSYFGKYKNQEFSSKNNSDTPLYSRRTKSNSGSTVQQVRGVLIDRFGKETIDELERQGKLEIIQDYQVEGVEGFYYNGKAVLVASNLTAESTVPTFLHELGGHAGFQNMMNQKQYNELMNQFNKLVEQGNPVALAAKMLAEREQGSERQQLEYLPYLLTLSSTMQQRNVIQRNALQKLINNIVSYVKAWVFDNFGINLNLNPDDMLALSERMIGQIKHQSSLDLIRQKYHGTNQWMTAPNGAKTHLSEQQWLQVRTPEFKKWFGDWENDAANASQVLDENGEPKVVYHGTATEFNEFKQGHGLLGDGIYLTDSFDTADVYANIRGENGFVLPLFVNIRNAFKTTGNVSRDEFVEATTSGKYQGIVHQFENQEYIVALEPNQVKMAEGNKGTFNSESSDIRFSRSSNYDDITNRIANGFKNLPKTGDWINKKGVDWLKFGLQALSRRHLTEIYGKLLPPLNKYNELAAQMDADKNDIAAEADNIVREWSKLKDEEALANVMHDATLAQIDPAKPYQQGDNKVKYQQLLHAYNNLSPEAQAMYKKARNAYSGHYAKVREAIRERILRSALSSQKKADLLQKIEGSFGQIKGVYFPLARFGKYVVVLRNQNGEAEVVSRAETKNEAESVRAELIKKYPQYKADDVKKDAEFNASRDSVGRGFMSDLFDEVGNLGLDAKSQADFEDTLSQLYLSSMPDLSWAKHGIHRKGTAGFSQDARRAFAQHMFSGANYLGKLRYGDQLAQQLDEMKKYSEDQFKKGVGYDQNSANDVIDEMEKRHELLMNPKGNPLSSFLTSVGFMYYMGLSPAAAMVNLSQTALVAYPIMGAKWGFDKAGKELLKASGEFGIGLKNGYKTPDFSSLKGFKNSVGDIYNPDIASILKGDELVAYEEAVKRGVIDVTQAHDLAGIAQGEDSKVMWYFRPAMRLASGMFHHAERFNREVTFIAAYRLARQHVNLDGSKSTHSEAFEQAMDAVYRGHFDYSAGNRARFMQGNVAKVLLLFKQYAQNMLYTLVRNAHQSIYALDPNEQKEARRALAGILGMTTLAAGAIGLPITGMLFTASILIAKKSKLGSAAFFAAWAVAFFGAADGDEEDPYELEIVIRNWLADIHPKFADLVFGGLPRAFSPVDVSSRVGLNNLIIPDVQEGLEGADWATAMQSALLGPVVGISTSTVKGLQQIQEGDYGRGIETMLPIFLKNAMKSYRYADEGVLTKNKDVIHDKDVTGVELFSQAIGFSPASVRTSYEGRSAIFQYRTKLEDHRRELMRKWVVARQEDDSDGMNKVWTEILEFNAKTAEKNPKMRISRMNLMQSYKATERKAKETGDGGVYLTKRQKGAEEQGGFAFNR